MESSMPVIAGALSTIMFLLGTMPMLSKAYRTKDLASYSLSNILLINAGNVVHSIYVFSLPAGPIWLLHTFHLLSTALMLSWYLRYEGLPASWRRVLPTPPYRHGKVASGLRLRVRRQALTGVGRTLTPQRADC